MGGTGSGRWGDHERKYTVEECLTLDLQAFERQGVFSEPGEEVCGEVVWMVPDTGAERAAINFTLKRWGDEMELQLDYRLPENEQTITTWVGVQTVKHCNRGVRYYGICPKCTRRVRKLHTTPDKNEFLCRSCHHLAYESSQTAHEIEGAMKSAAKLIGRMSNSQ